MTEPRVSWFQRLVGADSASIPGLEDQLVKAKEREHQLVGELAHEREQVAVREQRWEDAKSQARAAEQAFQAELAAVREASELLRTAHQELEKQHHQANTELAIARTQLVRQREEAAKLTKSLGATSATLEKAEIAQHAARSQISELERKLADAMEDAQAARGRLEELEVTAAHAVEEAANAKRRLKAADASASTSEHEVLEMKRAVQGAEAELGNATAELERTRVERETALTVATDAWRALEGALGEAAPLALALGVETGSVEGRASLEDASAALEARLEANLLCRSLRAQVDGDALRVEIRAPHFNAVSARWVVAFTTAFLEKSLGVDLAVESARQNETALTFSLRKSAPIA